MGLDLTLMPLRRNSNCSFSRIEVTRRRELFVDVGKLPSRPAPDNLMGFGGTEGEFAEMKIDPYGDLLKVVSAGDLAKLKDHEAVQDNDVNRAVWAYLGAIGPDTDIVLYWH